MPETYPNLIDGELVTTAATMEVVNPANEQVIALVPACGKEELDRAVAAARRAFQSWKKTPVDDRLARLSFRWSGSLRPAARRLPSRIAAWAGQYR